MALAFTALAAATASTSNTNSYAGNAGTPSSGDLLICFVSAQTTVAAGAMTGQWTWNLLTSFTKNSGADTIYVFWARTTGTTSTTPTFDCTGDNATGCIISCIRVTGQEGGGAPYLRQMKTATGSTANPAVAMDTAILTGNGCLGFCANGTNSAVQFTAPSTGGGWTEVHEVSHTNSPHGATTVSKVSGETGSTITWTNSNTTAWGAIILEFYVSGTGPIMLDDPGASGFFGIQGTY